MRFGNKNTKRPNLRVRGYFRVCRDLNLSQSALDGNLTHWPTPISSHCGGITLELFKQINHLEINFKDGCKI